MAEPEIPSLAPFHVRLETGETYLWCACGRSAQQPFCDGSHEGSGLEPLEFVHEGPSNRYSVCGCKHTKTPPICDGVHQELMAQRDDDAEAMERRFPKGEPILDEHRADCSFGAAVPDLPVTSAPAAVRYYAEVLGFAKVFDDAIVGFDHIMYACMGRGDFRITLNEHRAHEVDHKVAIYCHVDDVDALHAELTTRGANIVEGLTDRVWQARDFSVHDLGGHKITFSMQLEQKG